MTISIWYVGKQYTIIIILPTNIVICSLKKLAYNISLYIYIIGIGVNKNRCIQIVML